MLDMRDEVSLLSQLQIIWVPYHQNFSTNYVPAGVLSLQLFHSPSTAHVVVGINVYTSLCTTSYRVVILIKYTHWIYDRGKLFASQGYFSFPATYECCVITITFGITVFLVSKWTTAYTYDSYESVYRADVVLTEVDVAILQMLLTVIHIPLVLIFGKSSQWELSFCLMIFWSAGNRPHKVFVGVYFTLTTLVSSYCTAAGNGFIQRLKIASSAAELVRSKFCTYTLMFALSRSCLGFFSTSLSPCCSLPILEFYSHYILPQNGVQTMGTSWNCKMDSSLEVQMVSACLV
ncbi:uncharacterized protein LOC113296069 [Papaver somniferum]|uniref:uncharacterized protein LOC113296069 n=1 Tax=Papaver somniferum TaxID=3469 RepID=UPI000E704944|nr:uncharacterized protein LOC113296069 [Papaver somniferum]